MPDKSALEQDYIATLDVLRSTLEYLERLPVHPMTHEQIRRIRAHLEDPRRNADAKRLQLRARTLIGCDYSPAGTPRIAARLGGDDVLHLRGPVLRSNGARNDLAPQIIEMLEKGCRIRLHPARDESWSPELHWAAVNQR